MYATMKTTAASLPSLHGYWEDINSRRWMSVCWDWNHCTQSSNNKLSPLPFLPSCLLQSSSLPELKTGRGWGGGGGSLFLFLSFFHFLPPCFSNLSSAASPGLSLVTSAGQTGGSACLFPCLSVLYHAALFFIQSDKNRGWRLWIRNARGSFAPRRWKDVIFFFLALFRIPTGLRWIQTIMSYYRRRREQNRWTFDGIKPSQRWLQMCTES